MVACGWDIPNRKARLEYAKAGLEREILTQNTAEGVNREEAAEYIQFIDDFFLIAAVVGRRAGVEFSEAYNKRLHSMADYMNAMLDCNCNYPMYGDGDDGFVLRPDSGGHFNNFKSLLSSFAVYFEDASFKRAGVMWDEKNELLFGYEGRKKFLMLPTVNTGFLTDGNRFFPESGHFIFRRAEGIAGSGFCETYLHFDAAPLGFLSIAAHAHADALSFILHVDGFPVVVDPGTFTYHTQKDLRAYFVSTIAHNTVCVNGKNQANQAGPTMWLNHYKAKVVSCDEKSGEVVATHNGYASDGVTHMRKIQFNCDKNEFMIVDTLRCEKVATVEIPFHLHPETTVRLDGRMVALDVPGARRVMIELDEKLTYTVRDDGWYSEHFGEKVPMQYLYAKTECKGDAVFVTKLRVL